MYEGWDLHHRAEVEFEEEAPAGEQETEGRSITLEITAPSEGEAEIWNCYSVTPLQVEIKTNDIIPETCNVMGCCCC